MNIGKKLNELRIIKGFTQEELASRAFEGIYITIREESNLSFYAALIDILQCLGTDFMEPSF